MLSSYINQDNQESITLIFTENSVPPVCINPSHPAWNALSGSKSLTMSEEEVLDVLTPRSGGSAAAESWFDGLVTKDVYGMTIDGVPVSETIANGILAALGEKGEEINAEHIIAISRFLEKASQNTSLENADALYKWITQEKLTLDSSGDFIGYKSVTKVGETQFDHTFGKAIMPNIDEIDASSFLESYNVDVAYRPSYAGGGIVNGAVFNGYIPNFLGAIVEMPRDEVDPDGTVSCSVGLHVGTYAYASNYTGNNMLLVKVNPRDVVQVPDHDFNKLRVCRYQVVAEGQSGLLDSHLYIEDQYAPLVAEEHTEEEVQDITEDVVKTILARLRNI